MDSAPPHGGAAPFKVEAAILRLVFEWDPVKADLNRRKHRVPFEDAVFVFGDPLALTVPDESHEGRWITMGEANGKLLVVAHIDVERPTNEETCVVRIISAHRATKREAKDYHD
jgi:uncharacterized DUF497 family protein